MSYEGQRGGVGMTEKNVMVIVIDKNTVQVVTR